MAALANYNRQAADLHAGRQPREEDSNDSLTVKDLANTYLTFQEEKARRGLITVAWFDDCLIWQRYLLFLFVRRGGIHKADPT